MMLMRLTAAIGKPSIVVALVCSALLSGCGGNSVSRPAATTSDQLLNNGIDDAQRAKLRESNTDVISSSNSASSQSDSDVERSDGFEIPVIGETNNSETITGIEEAPKPSVQTVDAVVPPLPLPLFIDTVFGEMLGVPYLTGNGVSARSELVQLRSSGTFKSEDFLELIVSHLKDYGVTVTVENGAYKVIEDSALKSRMPRFIRSRSAPDTPGPLRPLVMFVELDAMSANEMSGILRQAFPDRNTLKIDSIPSINTITLAGLREDIEAAVLIIEEMDELSYAGTEVERYSPQYWSADEMARELNVMLSAEGWQASTTNAAKRTLLILPVKFSNDLFIFSKNALAMTRARFWLSQLDRPAKLGDVPQLYVYKVQNVDATLLAETVNQVLFGRGGARANNEIGQTNPAGSGAPTTLSNSVGGEIVVDVISNRLIYSGTASDYERLRGLLEQLDQPPGEVLIEVTIAEITLTDETRYGMDFLIDSLGNQDVSITTQNAGIGVGSSGLTTTILSGNVSASINAFASNSEVTILSRPRLLARSGGAAQIQVGTDVPVITSQSAGSTQANGSTDVLQSVEYRKTGVLLSIEPVIFSQNRIDLSISQEVSSAQPTTIADISSPTISNRNLDTQLSLEDGQTVVLGGLMQTDITESESGIPLLKDVPVAGNLFRNNVLSQTQTELLVLITAYIQRGREDKALFTDAFVQQLNDSLNATDNLTTVLPSNFGNRQPLNLPWRFGGEDAGSARGNGSASRGSEDVQRDEQIDEGSRSNRE